MGQRFLRFESARSIKGILKNSGDYFGMKYLMVDINT